MLTKQQIEEIRALLEQAQNPLFFFDNDVDGLCSFLLLQRKISRGKGIPVRTFPDLNKSYLRKIDELNPDFVFILDKPRVEKEFIEGVIEKNIPIVWIDHHDVQVEKEILEKVHYFNSFPSSEPVTYLSYLVSGKKEDQWLAMIGCIGDVYMPDFAKDFAEEYPELFNAKLGAFDSLFSTQVGKTVKILNLGLKDSITNVISMIKFLMKAKNIYDVLEENKFTKQLHFRYNKLMKVYDKIMKKAEASVTSKKLLFFSYSGETSMSSEIANGLYFNHKTKFIVVAFIKPDKINVSIRGKNAKQIIQKAIEDIENASGGGHEEACGAQIPVDKLEEFKDRLEKLVN